MRNLTFIIFILFLSIKTIGQPDTSRAATWKITKYYGSAGVIMSRPGPFVKIATGFYFDHQWGLEFDAMMSNYRAKNYPPNYKVGFCFFGNCKPTDNVEVYTLLINKEFNRRGKKIFLVMGAGPSFIIYDETQFKPKDTAGFSSFLSGSNYDRFTSRQHGLGLSASAKLRFQPSRHIALDLGWLSNFNNARTVHGVEISIVAGLLRSRSN